MAASTGFLVSAELLDNPSRVARSRPGSKLSAMGLHPSHALKVLVVDSEELHGYACTLLSSGEDADSAMGGEAAMFRFDKRPYHIALIAVGKSLLRTMVLAAGMRAKSGSTRCVGAWPSSRVRRAYATTKTASFPGAACRAR